MMTRRAPTQDELLQVRTKAREIGRKHDIRVSVKKGTGSMRGTISVQSGFEDDNVQARIEMGEWFIANGFESCFAPSNTIENHYLLLAREWDHGSLGCSLVKVTP